jgi:CCR4-NOT transcriptional complex subunit CAF120
LVIATNPRFSFEHASPEQTHTSEETAFPTPTQEFPYNIPFKQTSDNHFNENSLQFPSVPSHEQGVSSRTYQPPQFNSSPMSAKSSSSATQGHNPQLSTDSSSTISTPSRLQTRESIIRKPLPRTSSIKTPISAETDSSAGSLGRHVLDQAGFNMVGPERRNFTPKPEGQIQRQNSDVASLYDDAASTASPDYASTKRPSIETQRSVERPRAGVMRTVGKTESEESLSKKSTNAGIDIDFGPTFYASRPLPQTNQGSGSSQAYGRAASPGLGMSNYPVDRPPRQRSPAQRPDSASHSRSPNRPGMSSDQSHYRMGSADSRTLPWQPAMSTIVGSPALNQQGITPEQFVQQRAAVAPPMYMHQRHSSANILRANTPTPPPNQNRSSIYLGQLSHSRNSSADLLQRPVSRGGLAAMAPLGNGDIATSLSAREQEHVARVTGQPLINMATTNKTAPGAGLVGAIGKREREKEQIKQGINSQAVQSAIAQRQQQALHQQQQYPGEVASNYRNSQYGNMQQYQQYPIQGQGQQAWASPGPNVYAQGAGYMTPSPGYAVPMDARTGSPSPQFPPQQQYFPTQQGYQSQRGQGRGDQGFHGHGF